MPKVSRFLLGTLYSKFSSTSNLLIDLSRPGGRCFCGSALLLRQVECKKDTTRTDMPWLEACYTGTGFPNHFYLGHTLYWHYSPTMALGDRVKLWNACLCRKFKLDVRLRNSKRFYKDYTSSDIVSAYKQHMVYFTRERPTLHRVRFCISNHLWLGGYFCTALASNNIKWWWSWWSWWS